MQLVIIVLAICSLFSFAISYFNYRAYGAGYPFLALWAIYLTPVTLVLFMSLHVLFNIVLCTYKFLDHQLVQNFDLYANLLSGIFLFSMGIYGLRQVKAILHKKQEAGRRYLVTVLLVLVLCVLIIPINITGLIPFSTSIVSLLTFWIIKYRERKLNASVVVAAPDRRCRGDYSVL